MTSYAKEYKLMYCVFWMCHSVLYEYMIFDSTLQISIFLHSQEVMQNFNSNTSKLHVEDLLIRMSLNCQS